MAFPHTLLTLGAATGLWLSAYTLSFSRQVLQTHPVAANFGIPGSAYGSLLARLIRNSLYSYWHGGQSSNVGAISTPNEIPSSIANRFDRRSGGPVIEEKAASWLEARIRLISRLEAWRTKRNSAFQLSSEHQRYLNAAADWRLRLAYQLDPGDVMLYEVLHFQIISHLHPPEAARRATDVLARDAIAFSLREQSSFSALLTGAGAAVNVLNDLLDSDALTRTPEVVLHHLNLLDRFLMSYRSLKSKAQSEGWWDKMPVIRQQELQEHYLLLERVCGVIHMQISAVDRRAEIQRP